MAEKDVTVFLDEAGVGYELLLRAGISDLVCSKGRRGTWPRI